MNYENKIIEKYNLDTCEIVWATEGCEQKVIVTPDVDEDTQANIEEDLDTMYEEYLGERTLAFFLVYNKSKLN